MGLCFSAAPAVDNLMSHPRKMRSSMTENRITSALQKRKEDHKHDAHPLTFEKILLKFERMRLHLNTIKSIFSEFSSDGKSINFEGLRSTITKFGGTMSSDEIRDLFNFVDLDDSNSIEIKEFLVTLTIGSVLDLLKFDGSEQEKEIKEVLGLIVSAYLIFDPNASGTITRNDIDKMITDNSNHAQQHAGIGGAFLSKQRWDEMDWDHNGNIDFAEFVFAFSKWIDLEEDDQ